MRGVAAKVGCSAPALYQYFRDKNALLATIAHEGHQALDRALRLAMTEGASPAKRLRAAVRGLWDFAGDNRESYAVMFGLDGQIAADGTHLAPLALRQAAAELVLKREGADKDGAAAADLADRLFAMVHGFVGLRPALAKPGSEDRPLALLLVSVDDAIKAVGRR